MKRILLEIARAVIASHFKGETVERATLLKREPELTHNGACFITLTKNGKLRGCIGSLEAQRCLLDDVIANAHAAAFDDPRFPALQERELAEVQIEISLLTPSTPVDYRDEEDLKTKITPHRDGVVLQLQEHRATFLPQVWQQLPSHELFFSHLCRKAGLSPEAMAQHPRIATYRVEKVSDDELL